MGFHDDSVGKESACNVGDLGSIPGLGRSLGEDKSYLLQYSCLENPMAQKSLVNYSLWSHKELDMIDLLTLSYTCILIYIKYILYICNVYVYIYCCCLIAQLCLLFATSWTVCSLPGSSVMGLSRQEYWGGLPFHPPSDLPDPGIKPIYICIFTHTHTHTHTYNEIEFSFPGAFTTFLQIQKSIDIC